VSRYEARCPSCGAEVVFTLGSSLARVCGHCGSLVARKGANLENYGKVADLVATGSVLKLGLKGGYQGAPAFEIVGRVQLDHGSGTWDEWLLGFDNDSWSWLAESQGKFHYMGSVPLPPVPAFEQLDVGETVDLGKPGVFVVTEVREGRFVSAEGEIPFDVEPGSPLHYADLSGPGGQFATLDYGTGSTAEALYVGREVDVEQLGIRGLAAPEEKRKRAQGGALACPQCGGPLELKAPDLTQRVGCPWCGSLLDATKDLRVLEVLSKPPLKPAFPLGSKARIDGVEWTLLGLMERSVTVEGVRYPWREYLLHEPKQGFRWLVEAKGHWSFVQPIGAGDVRDRIGGNKEYQDSGFKHFQSGRARVDHVLGEFYWEVARGDSTETHDYVAPPLMLSQERAEREINWSLGRYVPADEVWSAFRAKGRPPAAQGIAPHQPSPYGETARSVLSNAMLAGALVVFGFVALALFGSRTVHSQSFSIPPAAKPGAPESAAFSEPFEVPRRGNLQVAVQAPVSNSWLYLEGALLNEETGGLDEFDTEIAYYHGSDSDGAWTEGGQNGQAYIGRVPRGRYVLRLQPQWEAGKPPPSYNVTVRSGVPRLYQALLALMAIGAFPMLVAWRWMRFEAERWSESDHPWGASGEGDDE
jgi:hypothetical protein